METQTRTPGPWTLEPNGAAFNLESPEREGHFMILLGMLGSAEGEHASNAKLVAVAPELLKGCKIAQALLEEKGVPINHAVLEFLRNVIAKTS